MNKYKTKSQNIEYPLRKLAKKYWPIYGGFPKDFSSEKFPKIIKHSQLMSMIKDNLSVIPKNDIDVLQKKAQKAISFAKKHAPKPVCSMGQVFASTLYDVKNKGKVCGKLMVCAVDDVHPAHLNKAIFNSAETKITIVRMLKFLSQKGKINSSQLNNIEKRILKDIKSKKLNCVQISKVISKAIGSKVKLCRKRSGVLLPKKYCPTMCAERNAFLNGKVGKIIFQSIAKNDCKTITVMPIAKFEKYKEGVAQQNLVFDIKAIVSASVPCPQCSKFIVDQQIPIIVIPKIMNLTPDYYEVTSLYYLLKKRVVIIN